MPEPIAVIGSSCRFPGGASDPSKLWDLLEQPRDVLTSFPPERLNLKRFYHHNGEHHGSTDVEGCAYLLEEDWREFDASFFNINPREAESMDPQQRILLESVYEAIESSGYRLDQMNGSRTSVHVGIMTADFADLQLRDTETLPTYHATGTARSILSNRISYFFNLKGPSVTVDTACSSSLVALHQAVQGLRSGDAQTAIVAGANLILEPAMFIAESKLHMLSADSRSRMWDKSANGYARGEGFAALLLKPLSEAIADGDAIEGVIRETGVNSDGRSAKGITNPSAEAQTALIRETYRRAGLDILKDRCQFFECHGTGTLAGDPVEARAIRDAFFPPGTEQSVSTSTAPLYVGSVKTIIGHLEGCAGLAGVLKALLAVRHRKIPPNMHFTELNPEIAPFYERMEIPTAALPWPSSASEPARASVNSFGFGGTNAHVIIESFSPNLSEHAGRPIANQDPLQDAFVGPLLFSAHSETSLHASVRAYLERLKQDPLLDLESLAWTLQSKRSNFTRRTFFSGASRGRLINFMQKFVDDPSGSGSASLESTLINPNEQPGILGIFTGQGAQWASMGKSLIASSPLFCKTIERCETALFDIQDPPSWSLKAELLKDDAQSRIGEAALSQPLCTAIQLAMVELVRAAGIKLDAVVGHSSGEIAAVYAAGILDLSSAMRIAYYRGFYANLACGAEGRAGRMMAVGMSYDAALTFCEQPQYSGRVVVAASNSPNSVTLSGDEDSIAEAKQYFDAKNVFARMLRTDTAYHSHHMEPCLGPYLKALKNCNIQVNEPLSDCIWISSVNGDTDLLNDLSSLKDQYWVDNMRSPVLFSQAVEISLYNGGPFDAALELGPHPALKGPVEQTLKAAFGSAPAYAGMMRRGDDEVEAFSGGLGYLWSHLGPKYIDFDGYRAAFKEHAPIKPPTLKGLPRYVWDHSQNHWRESRISRRYRLQDHPYHPLLGRRVSDDADDEPRWRNVIKLTELPWIRGHVFQGQALFPGAGYVVMALEAARKIAEQRPIRLIELEDVSLVRAIVVPDNASGIETVFSVKIESTSKKELIAHFTCYFCPNEASADLVKACSGRLCIQFDDSQRMTLPPRTQQAPELVPVDMVRFYEAMRGVGLEYSGHFHGLKSGRRALEVATISASWSASDVDSTYLLHPGIIDVAFQALCVAFASPASGDIWAPYLPIKIQRLSVDPNARLANSTPNMGFEADAYVSAGGSNLITGDIDVYGCSEDSALMQIEGLAMQAMSDPSAENDKALFATTSWVKDIMSGLDAADTSEDFLDDHDLVEALDRVSLFYWQNLLREMALPTAPEVSWYHNRMLQAGKALIALIQKEEHPVAKSSWLHDSSQLIAEIFDSYRERADMRLIKAVGENIPAVFRGDTQLLEVMLENDLLNRFYMEGLGLPVINDAISSAVKQICDKYPQASILEVGAGTGGTTRKIMDTAGVSFSSYTYTDISTGFFEKASEKFSDYKSKMVFKPLDVEKDVLEQGFPKHGYDVIIAANVLHATRRLKETMQHVRDLLKPGGYLILLEITGLEILRTQFIMGGLPGWWYGADEGRQLSPAISALQWEQLLQETGFSGVDHIMHDMQDDSQHTFSLMISQAVNDQVALIRDPLTVPMCLEAPQGIVIIGGKTLPNSKMIASISKCLQPWKKHIRQLQSIDDLQQAKSMPFGSSILLLEELDQPFFSTSISDTKLNALQNLLMSAKDVLWVTRGRLALPNANMSVGIARALMQEMPDLRIQHLDLPTHRSPLDDARAVSECFLRLRAALHPSLGTEDHMLWTLEPELRIANDEILIPRIQQHKDLNDSFNASRRSITRTVSAGAECVELVFKADGAKLHLRKDLSPFQHGNSVMRVDFAMRLVSAGTQNIFICSGSTTNGQQAVALSSECKSWVQLDSGSHVLTGATKAAAPTFVASVADCMTASILCKALPAQGTIVFNELPESLAHMLSQSSECDRFIFISSRQHFLAGQHICMHPKTTKRSIKRQLPSNVTCLVEAPDAQSLRSVLPSGTLVLHPGILPEPSGCYTTQQVLTRVAEQGNLVSACRSAESTSPINVPASFRIQDIIGAYPGLSSNYIIDWTDNAPMAVALLPPQHKGLIKSDRTYFLVGMTGGLGLSITQWMIRNGARSIVLASRSANVSTLWLEDMRALGVNVKLSQVDVADKGSLQALLDDVKATMPQIAGVCNASMVLNDKLFMDMETKDFNITLRPKAEGSRLLDEAFFDTDLDFFIFFSSLATTIGNAGQSNYHVANQYMSGLAAQRRQRGRVASVMHIGLVTDVGYVARMGQAMEDHLRSLFFMPLSEADIHHAFAEAIEASKVDNGHDSELVIGIEPFIKTDAAGRRPPWEHNPRFGHFISSESRSAKGSSQTNLTGDIRQELQQAENEDTAFSIVEAAFCRKLEAMMQLAPNAVNTNVPLIDLGCDSLLAIEIRNWFLKEADMDMPVLKVLSGDTVAELCSYGTKQYLAKLVKPDEDVAPPVPEPKVKESLVSPIINNFSDAEQQSSSSSFVEIDNSEDDSSHTGGSMESSWPQSMDSSIINPSPASSTDGSIKEDQMPVSKVTDLSEKGEPASMRDSGPASYAQSRLLFLNKYLSDPTTYNVAIAYDIIGELHVTRLRRALSMVISHHLSLQTRFFEDPSTGALMQGILDYPTADVIFSDARSDVEVQLEFSRRKTQVWDLATGKTMGVSVVSLNSEHHVIVFGYHHIILDGFSWAIFLDDLNRAYTLQALHPSGQYLDFSRAQKQPLSDETREDITYWRSQFATLPEVTPLLPFANPTKRADLKAYDSHVVNRTLDKSLVTLMKSTSRKLRVTICHFYLAVIQTMIARLSGVHDICIGLADANRRDERYGRTVGFFLNLLPIRGQCSNDIEFEKIAQATSRTVLEAIAHSRAPFEIILDSLQVPRSQAHSPLFQIAVNYRTSDVLGGQLGPAKMELRQAHDAGNPYDLSWGVTERADGTCHLELSTQKQLYSASAAEQLMDLFVYTLETLSIEPRTLVRDCPTARPSGLDRAVQLGQGPRVQFDWPPSLFDRFHDMVRRYPDQVAINDEYGDVTYTELHTMCGNISDALSEAGAGCLTRVGVLCRPSRYSVASMLAVISNGSTFVPLDLRLPGARHQVMLQSGQAQVLLYQTDTRDSAEKLRASSEQQLQTIDVCGLPETVKRPIQGCGHLAAFLLFTSGTTGIPKGVEIRQDSFLNHLALKTDVLSIGQEIVLQQSSLGFDMSIVQSFCALANGGTLVVAPISVRGDPVAISKLISEKNVTFTIATPSEYATLLDHGIERLESNAAWSQACMGGEKVTPQLVDKFKKLGLPNMRLINCYGPTEVTAAATFHDISRAAGKVVDDQGHSLVGKALPNYSVIIMDTQGKALPLGCAGEIYIGGAGVARGYYGRQEETEASFIKNPYATSSDIARGWSHLYKTGDKGRLLSDGTLVFLGRMEGDSQVKLRGLRIELDDISNNILETAAGLIEEAVTTIRGDPAFLVAHVVLHHEVEMSPTQLRELAHRLPLPQYMIPAAIVAIECLPMTANGKVDRDALASLPIPEQEPSGTQTNAVTLSEGQLRRLWQTLLRPTGPATELSRDSDFFMQGGNSAVLIRLQAAIRAEFDVQIPIVDLYGASTLGEMAARISAQQESQGLQGAAAIDWDVETCPPDQTSSIVGPKNQIGKEGLGVLLTGSTSFLGGSILLTLLNRPEVDKVHCVAVAESEIGSLPRSEKLVIYTGTLLHPSLGLCDDELTKLGHGVDVIIHAGANGHCLNNYSSLRVPNVESTRFLAGMASQHGIPIHYLSANRVTLLSGSTELAPVSVAAFAPPTDGSEGYTASKWASERLLERTSSMTGLRVCVHRACAATGAAAPSEDALNALLKFSLALRVAPKFTNFDGYFDFKDVAELSRDIVDQVLKDFNALPAAVPLLRYLHHSSKKKVPVQDLRTHMEAVHGEIFEEVDVVDWISLASSKGLDPLIASYLEAVVQRKEVVRFPYLGTE